MDETLLFPMTCSKLIKPRNITDIHAQRFGKFLQCTCDIRHGMGMRECFWKKIFLYLKTTCKIRIVARHTGALHNTSSKDLCKDEFIFYQDSSSCHTSKFIFKLLTERKISLLNWSTNSPDLNLWHHLKKKVLGRVSKNKIEFIPTLKTS